MPVTKTMIRKLLLRLCLYYEQHIDDQPNIPQAELQAMLNDELDKTADEIMELFGQDF